MNFGTSPPYSLITQLHFNHFPGNLVRLTLNTNGKETYSIIDASTFYYVNLSRSDVSKVERLHVSHRLFTLQYSLTLLYLLCILCSPYVVSIVKNIIHEWIWKRVYCLRFNMHSVHCVSKNIFIRSSSV